jgi:GntR family transcriptional regulator
MFLHIEPSDHLAIYDQVVRQIKFSVASGAIQPGEFVASVRELARDLAINPNTVSRAYRQLQDDGVLESVRGTGLAVAQGAPARCRRERIELIGERIEQALSEGRQSQLSRTEMEQLVTKQLANVYQGEAQR